MKIQQCVQLFKYRINQYKINNNNKIKIFEILKIKRETWKEYYHTRTILNNINKNIQKQPNKKITNLYSLLKREDFILDAFTNLIKKQNFISSKLNFLTIDVFLKKNVIKINKNLINEKYKFSKVNNKYIEKFKNKKQIILSYCSDLIVQEMIRMILKAIYEPTSIYGSNIHKESNDILKFNKSPHDAIKKLKKQSQRMKFCLEGKIIKAYSNVHHQKLIQILKEKINDKKFIKLIKQALQCGIIQKTKYYDTVLKISQKRIISFMLFNIYMLKFDEYIKKKIQNSISNEKKIQIKIFKIKIYTKVTNKIVNKKKIINRLRETKKINQVVNGKEKTKINYTILKKEIKKLKAKKILKLCTITKKKKLKLQYIRYADDWIILTNCKQKIIGKLKTEIKKYLKKELNLELSEKNTKIINLNKHSSKFLGFNFTYNNSYSSLKKIKKEIKEENLTNTTQPILDIGIDIHLLNQKLTYKKFKHEKLYRGIKKPEWTVLPDYEIVQKYNQIIKELTNYYKPMLTKKSKIAKFIYILNYSCYHTLATKHRLTIRKTIKKYGIETKIKQKFKKNDKIETRLIKLINYRQAINLKI